MSQALIAITQDEGLPIVISQSITDERDDTLFEASMIRKVTTDAEYQSACGVLQALKRLEKQKDEAQETVGKPFFKKWKAIIKAADDWWTEAKQAEVSLKSMVGEYDRAQREKAQEAERQRQAEASRIEQERLKKLQESRQAKTDEGATQAAKQAEHLYAEKQLVLAAAPVVTPPKASGVSSSPDIAFQITDIHALYKSAPSVVDLVPKARELKALLKSGLRPEGVRVHEVVNTRVRA